MAKDCGGLLRQLRDRVSGFEGFVVLNLGLFAFAPLPARSETVWQKGIRSKRLSN